jgi:hypothetical protein
MVLLGQRHSTVESMRQHVTTVAGSPGALPTQRMLLLTLLGIGRALHKHCRSARPRLSGAEPTAPSLQIVLGDSRQLADGFIPPRSG